MQQTSACMGVTWLITQEGGGKSTMAFRNFNLRRSQFMERGQIGLNQSLIYTHLFPLLSTQFLYCLSSTQQTKKFILWEKGVRVAFYPQPHHQLTPISAFVIIWIHFGAQKNKNNIICKKFLDFVYSLVFEKRNKNSSNYFLVLR